MIYKEFKEKKLSALGLGAMRLPVIDGNDAVIDEEKAAQMISVTALPCTACRYCTAHCPQGLDIPALLALYNEHCSTEGGFIAPMAIMAYEEGKRPSACIGCRSCEAVCPQQIKISEAMEAFAKKLG